jgi:hypothetical protein
LVLTEEDDEVNNGDKVERSDEEEEEEEEDSRVDPDKSMRETSETKDTGIWSCDFNNILLKSFLSNFCFFYIISISLKLNFRRFVKHERKVLFIF